MIAPITRQGNTKPRKTIAEHLNDNEWVIPGFLEGQLRDYFRTDHGRPLPPWRDNEPQLTRDELIDAVGWLMLWHWADEAEAAAQRNTGADRG